MYQREDEQLETIHLYVVPEREYSEDTSVITVSPIHRTIASILCSLCLVGLLIIPASADIGPKTILVPLQLLPIQTFTTTVAIVPTGQQTIPATPAHGILTLYNGSILVQQLPKGFIVTSQGGVEIITDATATIPAGNPPAYGMAKVPAHAITLGSSGNIPALSITETYGSSLYLKNLTPFSGGADASTVIVATDTNRTDALLSARATLHTQAKTATALLDKPCDETTNQESLSLIVSWQCQFVTYAVPRGMQVLSFERKGNSVLLVIQQGGN